MSCLLSSISLRICAELRTLVASSRGLGPADLATTAPSTGKKGCHHASWTVGPLRPSPYGAAGRSRHGAAPTMKQWEPSCRRLN